MPDGSLVACHLAALMQRARLRCRASCGCKRRRAFRDRLCAAPRLGSGFSLIEVMIALAIAAIIAVATIPSYRDHVMRSRIPEATSGLLLTGMRLEQYYQDHRSYANVATSACGVAMPQPGRFAFNCTVPADGQSFVLSALGRGDGGMAGFGYTLNHLGAQRTTTLPADWGSAPVDCWVEKRGTAC